MWRKIAACPRLGGCIDTRDAGQHPTPEEPRRAEQEQHQIRHGNRPLEAEAATEVAPWRGHAKVERQSAAGRQRRSPAPMHHAGVGDSGWLVSVLDQSRGKRMRRQFQQYVRGFGAQAFARPFEFQHEATQTLIDLGLIDAPCQCGAQAGGLASEHAIDAAVVELSQAALEFEAEDRLFDHQQCRHRQRDVEQGQLQAQAMSAGRRRGHRRQLPE